MNERIENTQIIQHGSYTCRRTLKKLGEDFFLYFRSLEVFKRFADIDAYSGFWHVAFASTEPGQIAVKHGGTLVPLVGKHAFFIPPFSVVEWHVEPGRVDVLSYISTYRLPPDIPREPCYFALAAFPEIARPEDVFELVRAASGKVLLSREDGKCAVARRVKELIDATYRSPVLMAEISAELDLSPAVMARYFKRAYGIPPVVYRNKLRVFDSMYLLLTTGAAVSDVAFDVGFEDLSQYNRSFKKFVSSVPSKYRDGPSTH